MSDLLRRARELKSLVGQNQTPRHEQLRYALGSLSGLNVTAIEEHTWASLERSLAAVNAILDRYEMESVEDYQRIGDDDAAKGLEILSNAADAAIEAELDRIVAELDEAVKALPVDAIREARENRDLIVPRLIRLLCDVASAARENELPEGNAHYLALFLLSEFQAAEALPAIVEAVSLPGTLPEDLFGDAITETLARVLVQLADDAPKLLDDMIANRELNEYVRWEAAQAYLLMVRDGRMSRAEAVGRLKSHLREAIEREDIDVIAPLINELIDLAPTDALKEIMEAFDRNLVADFSVTKRDVNRAIAAGEAGVQENLARLPPTAIVDTIAELGPCFTGKVEEHKTPLPPSPTPAPHLVSQPSLALATQPAEPIVSRHAHIGRNDSCPCGSGKKFKKCCLSRE